LPNDVGFWQMDGVRVNLNLLKTFTPSIYGGLSASPWNLSGDRDGVFGVEIGQRISGVFETKASFITLFDADNFDRAILGLRFDVPGGGVFDVHRNTRRRFDFFARGSADLLTQELISGNASMTFRPLTALQFHANYRHETPLFPADSIFSVFAVEPIKEVSAGVDTDITDWLGVYGRYAHQFYGSSSAHSFDVAAVNRYIAGFSLSTAGNFGLKSGQTSLRVQLERLDDGARTYWRTYSALNRFVTQRWQVGVGHYYNSYQFSPIARVERAYSFQLSTTYLFHDNIRWLARIEDNINPDFKYNIRAYTSLRLDLDL
jgi:hypothetical protein